MTCRREFIYIQKSNAQLIINEMKCAEKILCSIEAISNLSNCVEIVDINKLKIIRKKHWVEQFLRQPQQKAFQFIFYCN